MLYVMKKIKQSVPSISPGLISFYNNNNNCIKECNREYENISQASIDRSSSIIAIRRMKKEMRIVVSIEHVHQNNKVKKF